MLSMSSGKMAIAATVVVSEADKSSVRNSSVLPVKTQSMLVDNVVPPAKVSTVKLLIFLSVF